MNLLNIFDESTTTACLQRIDKLKPETTPEWGKMNAGQMLAHLNVAYDITYDSNSPKPNFILKWILGKFIKNTVVGTDPYKKNGSTAPAFVIKGDRDFEKEKAKLIQHIKQTQKHGVTYFEGRENISFGKLSSSQWSNLFYKHLDHHFTQFGV